MTAETSLFAPAELPEWYLKNRIVLAPMTRSRAVENWVPSPHAADYYGQRSSAGLVITEATQVCPDATGYSRTPGVWSQEQIEGWRPVVDAIHARGSIAVMQLWHTGRISHPDNLPAGEPLAPSPIAADMPMWTDKAGAFLPCALPREMNETDIRRVIEDFAKAARNAAAAGFDGVEIHAANGYLIDQFSCSKSNKRTDRWGGDMAGRLRFFSEVVDAVANAIGKRRTGVRLSPYGTYGDISDSDPGRLYQTQLRLLAAADVAYVHVIRPLIRGSEDIGSSPRDREVVETARRLFPMTVIAAGGYTLELATQQIRQGLVDLVGFGKPFIANPDLPRRLAEGIDLAEFDPDLLYTPGPNGYSDYQSAT